ncbi:MAG: Ig domain-containing protein, partial [Clostridia bacterium]|nr:Ig domain-containing protein [Clostridia bacterium]
MGATSGGITFNANQTFTDYGEDIDNCPKNTKELMRPDEWDIKCSGAFVTSNAVLARRLMGTADVTTSSGLDKITPRSHLDIDNDFFDFWLVGDYSEYNTGSGAGFVAIHIMDALSTGGFQLQSEDQGKWKFSFEFTAHFSIDAQETVPFEMYIKAGTSAPGIVLNQKNITVKVGDTYTLTAVTTPAGSTVTWASNATAKATVSGGVVTGVAAGYAVISASITESTVTYTDICTVTVIPAS